MSLGPPSPQALVKAIQNAPELAMFGVRERSGTPSRLMWNAAQSLMEIVPEDTLEAEVSVENKDIGFVEAGQAAVVKVDAFPYTRFGYLRGKVLSVSNDAVESKANGLQYIVRVGLPTNQIAVGGKSVNLTPGMQVSAEVHTGRRTVAEYFFSPFVETVGQSMRER